MIGLQAMWFHYSVCAKNIQRGRDGGCLAFAAAGLPKFLVRTNEKNRRRWVDVAWYGTSLARREVEIEEGNKKGMRGETSFGGEAADVPWWLEKRREEREEAEGLAWWLSSRVRLKQGLHRWYSPMMDEVES
ncbi:hypothetical protein KY289_016491 [Solanum tuberosum]|nr:hypothetical protein KY289_016491 [Solanum tuberosum]